MLYSTESDEESESDKTVYTTGVVDLETPLYGSLDLGTTLDVIVPSSTIQNGFNYTWNITLYDIDGNFVTTPMYYFMAMDPPSITFSVDSIITSCEHEFTATYSQKQGEKYLYYTFSLYSNGVLVDTSGEKTEAKISYLYSGLKPGTEYRIDLVIVMNDRTEYESSRYFTVEYSFQQTPVFPIVRADKSKGCIDLDYPQSIYIAGHTNNSDNQDQYTSFKNTETGDIYTVAKLASEQYVYYDKIFESNPINIPEEFTIYLHENFLDLFVGNIIEMVDEATGELFQLYYNGRTFCYKFPGKSLVSYKIYENNMSCMQPSGTTIADLDYNALYILEDDTVITDSSVFMYNDITKNFWWHFTILPDNVFITRGDKYEESVVS